MRINNIEINNFLGLRHARFDLADTPVALIAGHNRVGKSSVRDGLRFAFTGAPGRVSLKKDYGALLSDGAKSGTIRVDADSHYNCGEWIHHPCAVVRQVEDGKVGNLEVDTQLIHGDQMPALPLVLDADTFARQPVDERRRQLFAIAGIDIKNVDVTARLNQRGLTGGIYEALLDDALPHIKIDGFDGGHKHCREQAREAKGRWRQITGETYGAKKAEGWQPEAAAFDDDNHQKLVAQRDRLETRVGELRERVGELRAKTDNTIDEAERAQLEEVAGKLAARQQLVTDTERKLEAARTEKAESDAQAKTEAAAEQEQQAADARAADKQHRAQINNEAADAMRKCGITDDQAKALVRQIAMRQVPHVSISY